jgi:DNA-binding response OmpR family regulator
LVDGLTALPYHPNTLATIVPIRARHERGPDRRLVPRGGRRAEDRPGRFPRIAIIEQYEGVRRPCARYLQHFNFDVVEAADLRKGLELIEAAPPAVILVAPTDAPEFDRLQAKASVLGIPLLSLASASPEEEEPAGPVPAGVLLKPFTLGAMLDEIRRLLRVRTLAAQGNAAPA